MSVLFSIKVSTMFHKFLLGSKIFYHFFPWCSKGFYGFLKCSAIFQQFQCCSITVKKIQEWSTSWSCYLGHGWYLNGWCSLFIYKSPEWRWFEKQLHFLVPVIFHTRPAASHKVFRLGSLGHENVYIDFNSIWYLLDSFLSQIQCSPRWDSKYTDVI